MFIVISIIFSFVPFGITGNIYLKSPHNITVIPPKGQLTSFLKSCNVLFKASKQYLFVIGALSHKINIILSINFASCVYFLIWQVENLSIENGMRNLDCAVRHFGNNNDVMPMLL